MDLSPRRFYHVCLQRLTNEEIWQYTRKKTNSPKTTKSSRNNKDKTCKPKRRTQRKTIPSRLNKNIVEHTAHSTKYQSSKAVMPIYVNKNKTAEDSTHISKQQNAKTATQCDANKNKTAEDSVHISKQQNSEKAISKCVIDGTSEDNILIAPKAILKRKKFDSIIETRQNSTKQDNNSFDNQMTSKRQRIKNYYFFKTDNNNAGNIIVPPQKRKSDSEFETQSTLRSISNQSFEISPKKLRQETSVCDNTNISITNTKITTAPKFIKNKNQLSCNQSTTSKNKRSEKETLNGNKTKVTIIDNSEILQNERVATYSEMQKNRSPFSKNLEMDNEDIYVVYDNFSTEDRNLNVQSHDINILIRNHEHNTTYQSKINNASRKNSHDEIENSRKLLNSMPVYNTNKRYFKTFTAAYDNSLRKNTVFTIENLYRMRHISELDLSSSFRYGNQFSSHLTNKIIRLPIDTSEYRFDTACDLNESFLFNLIAAEDSDKLKLDKLQNIECVIYYSCKINKNLNSDNRTKTNFAGRVILTSDTKHLIKYPADLKKYLLNTNKRDFPYLRRRSRYKNVDDTNRPSNEVDVYFTLHKMIQAISKKYEKQKHWYKCKCCSSPFSTYNELEPICRTCNIYCTLDFHVKHFDSKDFSKINKRCSFISRKIKHICTNNTTRIAKLDKTDLEKALSLGSNENNVTSGKYSTKSLTTVKDELIHETAVNLETFENSSVTNPINNTCLHLMSGSPVTDRQECQQKLLVENTDEGKDANTGAELIMLDTSEGCGEHGTCMVTEGIPQIFETLTEIEKIDMSGVIEGIMQALDAEIENPDITVENDAMPEHLEGEITDEKDGCEGQDDAILLKSTKTAQFENTMLPSLDAEPQGQDNDDSNIQFISLDDSNSGEISPTVEVTVADDEQNLSKNNSVPSCTSQSIGTTSISEPDISEIIEYTSIRPDSPEIEIIDAIIKPLKSSSDTDNPKLHSPTIDEPQKNLSKKSPILTSISRPDSPDIEIIDAIIKPIKSSNNTDNAKLHSTTIDEPEKNLSKKSPNSNCISQTESAEIQIIKDTRVCLSSNDTSNPKLPSGTIDGTERNLSENSSKLTFISEPDSSEIRITKCISISQSMDIPNLLSTTTDVPADLSENSSLPTGMPNLLSTTTDVSADLSENSSIPTDMPNLLATTTDVSADLSENSSLPTDIPNLLATTTDVSDDLSENSSLPTNISRCFALKIQIIEFNSVCQSSDTQDPKLLHESVLKIPVEMDSIEMPSNMNDNFVNNEGNLSENSLEPVCNSQSECSKIQILEYKSLRQSDPKLSSNIIEESGANFSENSQIATNELLWNSAISDKVIFSRTLPTSNVTDTSINSIEEATLEEEVQRKAAENANSALERDFCYISDIKDHSESNFTTDINSYVNDSHSENSKKDDEFTHTSPIVDLNNSAISSKEDVPLREKVQIKDADSNCTYERNVCESSDTKDNKESNFTSDKNSYMNDAGESTERDIPKSNSISPEFLNSQNSNNISLKTEKKGNDYAQTLLPANVNESFISCTEEITSEEVVQIKTAKNFTVERDFSGTKDHSESDFISDRDSYLNDCNSEKESTTLIPDSNSLSDEFFNFRKAKKGDDDYTRTLPTASVADSPISSAKDVSVENEVERQTAENSNFSLETGSCDVSDTKDHSESNFISDRDSYLNDYISENSLRVSIDIEKSTKVIPEVNSVSHELLNSPNSNDLPLKKTQKYSDVSDCSFSSTEELSLEEKMQRKNSENSNYTPERYFNDFSDVKNHNESNLKQNTDKYKVSSSNFVYVDEDFPKVFLKYVRVLEDLLPQEIISVKRSNADGSENAYLTLEMLGIASTIASLDILNDYSKVSKFIDFVSKCIYYLENHENRDESEILKIKNFLKKLYVINDFIEKYGTYDKLVEDLLKNGGKISVWDSNRDGIKEGNLVRYSNTDRKLSKKKSFLETKDDLSTKGTTSNTCDTYLELLNNPALLAEVSHQTSSKHKNRYVKFCAVINCKACNIYSDRGGDKLEAIAKASEDYDESNAQMSSEYKNSNSHESGTHLHNKGLRLEKCIKKIKIMNEPISSDVSPGSSKKQLISVFQSTSLTNKSNTLSSTSESDVHVALTSPSKTITYDSISPVHDNDFSTNSETVTTFSENLVGADSSQLNNTSCLLDYSRVVEALTTEKNSEISKNRLSPKSLMDPVLKAKRPYRKRSDNTIKEKRKYRKRNAKPTQEQLPVSTSSISSLSQSIDTPVVGFKAKENALANPPIPLCNQNVSLYMSQEQQLASANPPIPLCNQNQSLCIDQGQQYPHANPPVPLGDHGAICMDQRQSLNASQASGNLHYNYKTNPPFDYRMSSYSSPSQVPPLTQSSSIQGVPHITGASSTSDALVRKNVTDSSSLSRCSVQTLVTARTDISFETQYTSSLGHLENFVSESRSSNTSRGEFSNSEKSIQNTRTSTGSRAVPYTPQYMPRYPETFSQRPPLHSSQTLSSTSQPSSQAMYTGHHTYSYQCYPSMPHGLSTMTQSTPIIPPSSYPQSSYSSSQSTPIIPSPSYTQSSHSSSQSTPIIQPSSYTQSSYSSSQSTPISPASSYMQSSSSAFQSTPIIPSPSCTQSSHSSFQPSPSLQRTPYPSPTMQQSSSDPRTLPYLHQVNLPHTHCTYK